MEYFSNHLNKPIIQQIQDLIEFSILVWLFFSPFSSLIKLDFAVVESLMIIVSILPANSKVKVSPRFLISHTTLVKY